jgi:hypothetical protein
VRYQFSFLLAVIEGSSMEPKSVLVFRSNRDCIGDGSIVGDTRWAGTFGVQADFIARTHCSIGIIKLEDIQVSYRVKL